MTNDKTVTMSRELAERISARLERLNAGFCELRALLATPVVERQEPIYQVMYRGDGGGGWCDADKESYDMKVPHPKHWKVRIVYASPPKLAELQAAIAMQREKLDAQEAEIERLKGGQGDPVAWFTEDHLTDKSATTYDVGVSVMWAVKGWPVTPLYTSQPAPVAASHPFADKVIRKLQRFEECASDSGADGVDIGRHWLDLLTQLGLLNRVQRSPALWEITQQGEDCLDKVKELNQSPIKCCQCGACPGGCVADAAEGLNQ